MLHVYVAIEDSVVKLKVTFPFGRGVGSLQSKNSLIIDL